MQTLDFADFDQDFKSLLPPEWSERWVSPGCGYSELADIYQACSGLLSRKLFSAWPGHSFWEPDVGPHSNLAAVLSALALAR